MRPLMKNTEREKMTQIMGSVVISSKAQENWVFKNRRISDENNWLCKAVLYIGLNSEWYFFTYMFIIIFFI